MDFSAPLFYGTKCLNAESTQINLWSDPYLSLSIGDPHSSS
jgi:hypothetical protein